VKFEEPTPSQKNLKEWVNTFSSFPATKSKIYTEHNKPVKNKAVIKYQQYYVRKLST